MGHEIQYFDYPENTNKTLVQRELDALAAKRGWQEGVTGLNKNITWHDNICIDENAAREFIESRDKGWYDQLAVKYREYPKLEPTKSLLSLRTRLDEEKKKKGKYTAEHSISTFKAEYIGCPKCGSKLKRELLRMETCPLCREDLRSKTTLDTITRYASNIKKLQHEIEAEERKMKEKALKKSTVKWLVKIEYHV